MNYPTIAPAIDPSTAPSTIGLPSRGSILRRLSLGALSCSCILALAPALMTSQALAEDEGDSFWTDFIPSTDTRLIFVSSSEGRDSNTGLTADSPVKSLSKGYALLRDGSPDWMLLKRGDTWNEALPNWGKSGRSESEVMILGAYGEETARPQVRPDGDTVGMQLVGGSAIEHVAFVGFRLEPLDRTIDQSSSGIRMLRSSHNILFEDLYISGFAANFIFQEHAGSTISDIRINGCVVVDAWSRSAHAQGLYAEGVGDFVIENSVFDHNGFDTERGAHPTIFNHNIYIQNEADGVVVRNNIISNASSHGIQLRSGGIIEDNLFAGNPLQILFGGGNYPNENGVTGHVKRNLIMYGRGISSSLPRSFGIETSNVRSAQFSENILIDGEVGYNGYPIRIHGPSAYGMSDLIISNNTLINWNGTIDIHHSPEGQEYRDISFIGNTIIRDMNNNHGNSNFNKSFVSAFDAEDPSLTFSENTYRHKGMHNRPFLSGGSVVDGDTWLSSVDQRSSIEEISEMPTGIGLGDYMASFRSDGSVDGFIAEARKLSRAHQDDRFTPGAVYEWVSGQVD